VLLIDFDCSFIKEGSNDMKTSKKPKGMSLGYCSPELYRYFNSSTKPQTVIDLMKSDIYSLGILMLEYMNFFDNYIPLSELDKYKMNPNDYQKCFISLIDIFSESLNTKAERNLIHLIKICLNYDPDKRLTAEQFMELFPNMF